MLFVSGYDHASPTNLYFYPDTDNVSMTMSPTKLCWPIHCLRLWVYCNLLLSLIFCFLCHIKWLFAVTC